MFGKKKNALVVYHTRTGHTGSAAEAIARGLESAKVTTTVKPLSKVKAEELEDYSMIAMGSPTHGGRPARPVRKFIRGLDKQALKGKSATTFTSYAQFRGKATLRSMKRLLKRKKAKVAPRGVAVKAGAPLSLWKGRDIKEKDLVRLEKLGRSLAKKG